MSDTTRSRSRSSLVPGAGVDSDFALVADAGEAFLLRMATARAARRSLDLQYYIWDNDQVGRRLIWVVLEAARRGVRVRLLLDHINQLGRDRNWATLNAHPNVEVRLFNPLRGRGLNLLRWLYRAPKLNRRMHNKAWIVDGEAAIVGGRNISEHYFGVNAVTNFRDLDIYADGPVAADTQEAFNRYWHSPLSVSLRQFRRRSSDDAEALWMSLDTEQRSRHRDDSVLSERTLQAVRARRVRAPAALLFDSPEKAHGSPQRLMGTQLARLLGRHSAREILLEASYFIPGDDFTRALSGWRKRGCRVAVLTNSLATNDVIAAHAAYQRYRPALVDAGLELHELQPNARSMMRQARLLRGRSKASLHTKAMVLDRRELFVGSFNADPRSVHFNTEMGYYIYSPSLAASVAAFIEEGMAPQNSYRLSREEGRLTWAGGSDQGPVVCHREPLVSIPRRLASAVLALLPIENLL
ncbi:phospholipase D family protein [Alloalcanivorax xenomutans]|uniref:Phospholipase D family protein n=1 Tax=Alloalcanivorax xenomutans TaxID=1094342 RepID=A0A9Q3W1F1_9GAMM|nr:phospholipase D family protein [Alloalcanivorax xenomutans]ARB47655.1 phospholipase [Alloalcanivorax xenomutans]MBA4719740.1 phospholipase D family protein [Alcanivorax sp.]MCE7507468.1 phospholipase D family protein [Alloalcanivorax xenomutans]MCE7523676.1 phospholipase D family protein [Alloalcanivorax xenomutans]